jgi:hypothetical protein
MTSNEVSIGFWAIGYTFHAFYRPFRCLSSRELLSSNPEDRMTHFFTRTVPPPHTDHSLWHSTTMVGLRARRFQILWLREKCSFRAIFVSYSTRFSAPGSTLSKPPGFLANPYRWHLMRVQLFFGHRVHVPCLLRAVSLPFEPRIAVIHSGRQNDTFRHSNGPSSTYRLYDFEKNVSFGPFSWAIAHDFRHPGQLFRNLPDFYQFLVDDILWGFRWFLGHRVHVQCLLRAVSLPFLLRITVNHFRGQNDTFLHSNGPSSMYRP